ncbi:type II secretion system F family protein [Stieleria sp. JC731]|uniref:type II secretion system F family protein n=1 Tax=Pirellulaceae TaxID=2691357 RepID=UPI001E5E9864|nr:type II secretion system F family protein [Stieleria sp. JC731]MCC9602749.1 type II secretion system F family protein [Stieleria sp. JC731]
MEIALLIVIFAMLTTSVFMLSRRLTLASNETLADQPMLFSAPALGGFNRALADSIPVSDSQRQRLSQDLSLSGSHHLNALDDFLAKRNIGILVCITLDAAGLAAGIADGVEAIYFSVAGTTLLMSYCVPRLILTSQSSKRRKELERAIPDVIDMVAMSIDGGVPLPKAIDQVELHCREMYPALASELRIVSRQAQSGSAEKAFDSFSKRIEMTEVAAWCAMMRQSQKLGGKLADSLREYAMRIRLDRQNRVERAGNSASLKLLLPVVLCLAPPIAILLVGPAVIEFRDFINRNKDATQTVIDKAQSGDVNAPI